MDMESSRRTLSGGHPDCRSLPCSPAPVGGSAPTLSPGRSPTESLDEGPPEAPVGQGENRKTGGRTAGPSTPAIPPWTRRFAPRPITSRGMQSGCVYPKFRRQHLFVGSGVIEAGCKTVVGSRFKQSGMFWTVRGANAILALRCSHLNGRFEDYWEERREARAA